MKALLIVIVTLLAAVQTNGCPREKEDCDLEEKWELFKFKFGKKYATCEEEKARMQIFARNQKVIDEHNMKYLKGEVTSMMAMNEFGDLRPEELAPMVSGLDRAAKHSLYEDPGNEIDDWSKHSPEKDK